MISKLLILIFILYLLQNYFYIYNSNSNILPNLWIGNRIGAHDHVFMHKKNIKLIINCTKHLDFINICDYRIKKYRLEVDDNFSNETHNNILKNIDNINKLIDKYLKEKKGVFIHCNAGMQRAATITACYLIFSRKYSLEEAVNFIKDKRYIAFRPFIHYYNTLLEFSRRKK